MDENYNPIDSGYVPQGSSQQGYDQTEYQPQGYGQPGSQTEYQPQGYGQADGQAGSQTEYQPQGYGQPGSQAGSQTEYQPQGYGQPGGQAGSQTEYQPQGYGQPGSQPGGQTNYQQPYGYANGYQQGMPGFVPQKKTSTKAVLSLIFGIAGILLCCGFGIMGIILGLAGVVMAILSKDDNEGRFEGLAIAGLIVSIIAFILGLSYVCLLVFAYIQDPELITTASAAVKSACTGVLS